MASSGGRRGGWQSVRSYYEAETPHFLKFLPSNSSQLGRMEIPDQFIRRHGQDLGESVILKVPSGDTWSLPLEKHGGKIWLGGAWKNFVDYYSLLPGCPVSFRLEGNSTFHVIIFGQRQSEIEYPVKKEYPDRGFVSPKDQEIGDGSPVKITGHFTPGQTRGHVMDFSTEAVDESSKQFPAQRVSSDTEYVPSEADDQSSTQSHAQTPDSESEFVPSESTNHVRRPRNRESVRAREAPEPSSPHGAPGAANFESNCPFFIAVIKRSYLNKHLYVPPRFMETHKLIQRMQAVTLQHLGRSWPAKLFCRPMKPGGYISSGWTEFSRQTNLQEGDTCLFKLMRRHGIIVFNVTIFRCNN